MGLRTIKKRENFEGKKREYNIFEDPSDKPVRKY